MSMLMKLVTLFAQGCLFLRKRTNTQRARILGVLLCTRCARETLGLS